MRPAPASIALDIMSGSGRVADPDHHDADTDAIALNSWMLSACAILGA